MPRFECSATSATGRAYLVPNDGCELVFLPRTPATISPALAVCSFAVSTTRPWKRRMEPGLR